MEEEKKWKIENLEREREGEPIDIIDRRDEKEIINRGRERKVSREVAGEERKGNKIKNLSLCFLFFFSLFFCVKLKSLWFGSLSL